MGRSWSHRKLALLWLWVIGIAALLGLGFAMLIRAELAYPGTQVITPATYSALVFGHGNLSVVFVLLPLALLALPHLTLFPASDAHSNEPPMLSVLAVVAFAAALTVWTIAFVMSMALPADDLTTGWVLYPPVDGAPPLPVRFGVMIAARVAAVGALVIGVVGLIWSALRRFKPALFVNPGFVALVPAAFWMSWLVLNDAWEKLRFLSGGEQQGAAAGASFDLVPAVFSQSSYLLALLLAAVAILHGAVILAAKREVLAKPVPFIVTIAIVVACVWTRFFQDGSLPAVIIALLLLLSLLWLLTLFYGAAGNRLVLVCLCGLLVFFGILAIGVESNLNEPMLQETYYVVAYDHAWAYAAFTLVVFAALHANFPSLARGTFATVAACVQVVLFILGSALTFVPQFFLGLAGMPRRYADYPEAFAAWNLASSLGAGVVAVSFGLFGLLALRAMRAGPHLSSR
jgi:cytochrome c oxidase subunit I